MLTPVKFGAGRQSMPRLSAPYVPGRRHSRFWTEDEIAVVQTIFPSRGAAACVEKLPGRNISSVYQQAYKLGLGRPRNVPKGPSLGDSLDARIKEMWPMAARRGGVAAIAGQLGVRSDFVSKRALVLQLTMPHGKEPPWTKAEEMLLRKAPINDLARASAFFAAHGFKRTPTAIMVRCKRMSISRRLTDVFSGRSAAAVLGIDSKTITRFIGEGLLIASLRNTKRLPQQGGDAYAIKPSDLRRFIIENIDRIDIRKVEKFSFVALIAGKSNG